jgi:MFS family permease
MQLTAEPDPSTDALSVEEALLLADRTGRYHRRVCVACLLSVACGGMGGAVAPFILTPVEREASLGPAAQGLFGSAMFIGMWAGSFVGGAISDAVGPGRTMTLAILGLVVFGAAPAAVPATAATAVLGRVTVGFSLVNTCTPRALSPPQRVTNAPTQPVRCAP